MAKSLSPVYVDMINSFKDQCTNLITAFKQKHYEDFSDFAELFRSNKFGLIYEKYKDTYFDYDFKEDTLQIAKDIMLNDHFLGGLYLLYGLYCMQDEPKQYIRLDYNEFEKVLELVKEERHTLLGTCQPGLVFAKLLRNEAFSFPYFGRNYTMEGSARVRLINNHSLVVREGKPINKKAWLDKFLKGMSITDDLRRVDEEYFKKKHKLKAEHSDLNLALDMLPEDTIGGLIEAVMDGDKHENNPDVDVGNRRRKLKNRSMKGKFVYDSSSSEKREDVIKHSNIKKKKGCPRGRRKSYFNLVVNRLESSSSSSSSEKSEPSTELNVDNFVLNMPDVH